MRVIIAIDQSHYWKQVIEAVTKRPWPPDTEFKILTVAEPLAAQAQDVIAWQQVAQEVLGRREEYAKSILQQARQAIENQCAHASVHAEFRHGSPRVEILRAATEWMADKIVIGAHGPAGNRFFPGVIPHTVVRQAHCSVELVRLKTAVEEAHERDYKKAACTK